MIDETLTCPAPSAPNAARTACKTFVRGLSLSRVQALVATLAGIVSVTGAVFSFIPVAHPPTTGELVTIIRDAGSRRIVTDATVEILTTEDAIVATLTPDATGRATQQLKEGVYIVRVSHPRYAAEVRRIQVMPQQTVEIRASLRKGSSSPVDRAVNSGVRAIRRAFRF